LFSSTESGTELPTPTSLHPTSPFAEASTRNRACLPCARRGGRQALQKGSLRPLASAFETFPEVEHCILKTRSWLWKRL
jgi:hypothetical protein